MPFGSTRNPIIPGYGRARRRRPDLRGTPRQRSRRKEVAGPYRGQSSVPAIRAEATPREHRRLPPRRTSPVFPSPTLPGATKTTGPSLPVDLNSVLESIGNRIDPGLSPLQNPVAEFEDWLGRVREHGDEPFPGVSDRSALGAALGTLQLGTGGAAAKGALAAAKGGSLVERLRAIKASQKAVRGAVRGKAGAAVKRVPKPVRTAGRVAGQVASAPIKHPFTAPVAAQAPSAVLSGDPREFGKAFTGEGTLAAIGSGVGGAVASITPTKVAENLVRDAFNLPAIVLPAVYLPLAGVVEASQGDSSRLRKLWGDYVEAGLIPAAVQGDGEGVLKAIEEHPLFSALEVSGTAALVGRGAGAAARGATRGRAGGTARPPVYIRGQEHLGNVNELMGRGRYSPDLIRQAAQRVYDARRGRYIEPRGGLKGLLGLDPATRALRHTARRFAYGQEQARRVNRANRQKLMRDIAPKGRFGRIDRASAGVVAQAVQRVAQKPEKFFDDLPAYRTQLEQSYRSGELTKVQQKANRAMVREIDLALDSADPAAVARTANAFMEEQGKIVTGLVERGLLNEDQAVRAALFPWARVHMGAGYGKPEALIRRLEGALEGKRAELRDEAAARLKGFQGSVETAKRRFQYAESGRIQAERTIATRRANLRRELAARKTKAGKARVAAKLDRAVKTAEAARARVGAARQELAEATAVLSRERGSLKAQVARQLREIEGEVARARAKPPQLLDRDGRPLPTETIVAAMQRQGVEPPGFLSQRPRTPGRAAFYQAAFPDRQTLRTQPRTGKATLQGTYDASYQALTEQLLFSGAKLDAAATYDALVRQFSTRVPEKVKSMRDAWDALADPERFGWQDPTPNLPKRPIRVAPFLAAREEIAKAQAHQGLDSPLLDPSQAAASEALTARLLSEAAKDGPGPYAYIPEPVYRELDGLFKRSGTGEKLGQALGQFAKSAWLPFSPSFHIGNWVDNYLRAALAGIGPTDIILGRQAIKGRRGIPGLVDRDLAASESILSGAGYSSVTRQRIHRDARSFEGSALQGYARGLEAFSKTPGPKQAYQVFLKSRDLLMSLNAALTERLPQYGAIGKEMRRELQATQGRWRHALMVSDDAFKDLLDGLRGTDKQIQYARAVEQVFSNWGKVGRAGRVLSSIAPFWQWARAATRFVALTLPAHHPIKTALVAAAAEMTEEERKRLGLDRFAEEALPEFLQGSLPFGGGIARNIPKYTSFGVFNDLPEFIGRLFLPQVQSPLEILKGFDWTGEKLTKADGTPIDGLERVGLAVLVAGEQFIPGLALLESATGISLPGNFGGETGPGKSSPGAVYKGDKLDYFRSLANSQQITVPVKGSGGSADSGLGGFTESYLDELGSGSSGGFTESYLKELGGG